MNRELKLPLPLLEVLEWDELQAVEYQRRLLIKLNLGLQDLREESVALLQV